MGINKFLYGIISLGDKSLLANKSARQFPQHAFLLPGGVVSRPDVLLAPDLAVGNGHPELQ